MVIFPIQTICNLFNWLDGGGKHFGSIVLLDFLPIVSHSIVAIFVIFNRECKRTSPPRDRHADRTVQYHSSQKKIHKPLTLIAKGKIT
jgi:hypothetical protein